MSTSISIIGYSSKEHPEFKKHLAAVKFCIENDLSFPKETEEFFKGKVGDGYNLDDLERNSLVEIVANGIQVPLTTHGEDFTNHHTINVAEIPKEVDQIIVKLS